MLGIKQKSKLILLTSIISVTCAIMLVQNYYVSTTLKGLELSLQSINQDLKSLATNASPASVASGNPQELSAIQNSQKQLQISIENIKLNSEALLRNAMAEKVEMIVKNKTTTEEKVIAIARWVSSNIANNTQFGSGAAAEVYKWFSGRAGQCGMRATLFVEMLKYINVYSQVYNMCKFPTCKEAHSNARVYYDGNWHFFDVTYAGYFKKDDKILSFEEIVDISKEEDPLKYLIVLEKTLDFSRHINPEDNNLHTLPEDKAIAASKINNITRMHRIYARDNVRNASGYGPYNNGKGFNCNKYCK